MDPWSTNEWSTEEDEDIQPHLNQFTSKWGHLNNDNDESEPPSKFGVDVPSWSISSAWDVGEDAWTSTGHAGHPTTDTTNSGPAWNPNLQESSSFTVQTAEEISEKTSDAGTVRPALPTPPSSPPVASSHLAPEDAEIDAQTLEIPEPSSSLTTPGLFGSFESAQKSSPGIVYENDDISWPKDATFEAETPLDEPWSSNWESTIKDTPVSESPPKDEWDAAREAQRKLNENIPQELLRLIISQWEAVAREHYSNYDLPGELDYSWRKGLDNVAGLLERVDSLIPPSYFTLPTPFAKSQIGKATKDALRLTRSYMLSQSSPMSQFYSPKGSSEWENLVKAENSIAQDEWGWDLKQRKEEVSESQDSGKGLEKKGGFLSFWKRRTPSESTVATTSSQPESFQAEKPKTPASSTPSLRPSLEINPLTPSRPKIPLDPDTNPIAETPSSDTESQFQPSVVSRFLNRLSRRPPSGIIVESAEADQRSSSQVSLSVDDLAFLSDMETKPTLGQHTSKPLGSINPVEEILSSKAPKIEKSPPLIPPPPSSYIFKTAKESRKPTDNIPGDSLIGLSSPSSMSPVSHSGENKSLFDHIGIPEDMSLSPQQQPSTTLDFLSASSFSSSSRVDASAPLKHQPRASSSTSILPLPHPLSLKYGQSKPSLSHFKPDNPVLYPSALDDFDDFVSSPAPPTARDANPTAMLSTNFVFEASRTDDPDAFGDFVSTSHSSDSQPSATHASLNPGKSYSMVDSRTKISGSIPLLKSASPFTSASSDSINRNRNRNLEGNKSGNPPRGTIPLLPPPSQLLSISQQTSTTPLISKTSLSHGTTPEPASISSVNKSGLSAQDLSFFEGL